jgi:thiol-disulfide isomerase/thioredoxin
MIPFKSLFFSKIILALYALILPQVGFCTLGHSVILLKNFKPISEEILASGVKAKNGNDFIVIQNPFNFLPDTAYTEGFTGKMDTVYVKHTNQTMMVEINFSPFVVGNHLLHKNDTLFLDFSDPSMVKEYFLNANRLKHDLQPTSSLSAEEWIELNGFDFLIKGFKKKGLVHKKREDLKRSSHVLDSLLAIKEIDPHFYQIRKEQRYFELLENTKDLVESKYQGLEEYRHYLQMKCFQKFESPLLKRSMAEGRHNSILFDSVSRDRSFSSPSRCYLMYYYLTHIEDAIAFKARYPNFSLQNCQPEYQAQILKDFPQIFDERANTEDSVFIVDSLKNESSLDQIVKKHIGKVVYVDFWASWCAPCLEAMPYSKRLAEKHSEVVFLFLALNDKYTSWLQMSKKKQITENNYLIINPQRSKFINKHQIKSIPRYMIYNKKGALVNADAPSPKSPLIEAEIIKALKE